MEHGLITDEDRWSAVATRDRAAGESFVYAVRTTGVFCRPGCSSRLPARKNVAFFDSAEAARAAGFRPCRRCVPEGRSVPAEWAEIAAKACRMLEESAVPPGNDHLAAAAGLSSSHFQRVFKQVTGLTPKQYSTSVRAGRLREGLADARTITDAVYEAGFGSSSRFYSAADGLLGMAAADYRNRGAGRRIAYGVAGCSLGLVLVAVTGRGICAVALGDDRSELVEDLRRRFPEAVLEPAGPSLEETIAAVVRLIEEPQGRFDLPVDVRGTVFQHQVWDALRRLPPGSTAGYAEIARAVGRPKAVRAVAAACAANPVAVVVPCHRVVRSDDGISGYRWGVERKRELLRRESAER